MKNLIYILILLPSLLFSQETKNMELVGVRTVKIPYNDNGLEIEFTVEEGNIMKILRVTHSGNPSSANKHFVQLDDEYIYFTEYYNGHSNFNITEPFFIDDGTYRLYTEKGSATLYGLEFKLTTP